VILAAGTPQILLPWDNAAIFQRNLDAYAGSSLASWTVWVAPRTMKSAEAARLVHMRESDLRAINRIPANMLIRAGSTLLAPRPASQMRDVGEHIADNGQLRLSPEKPVRRTLLKVGKRGDTVANIARRYRLPVGSVASWNNVSTSARFKYGDTVVVYMPSRVYTQQWRAPRSSSRARISKRPVSPTPQLAKR
jgi:membrane-bound lytic murein transglycosylase D